MMSTAMRVPELRRALLFAGSFVMVSLITKAFAGHEVGLIPMARAFLAPDRVPPAELVNVPLALRERTFVLYDTLFGRSGHLRARLLGADEAADMKELRRVFGADALTEPGVLGVATNDDPNAFSFILLRPWREKRGGYIGRYHVGQWPAERAAMPANYENPSGFVEVTPENAAIRLSTHFRLADFVTHDQESVWPKYVVLREALLDKLELVLTELESRGVAAGHVRVLSGFRTPQYNARIVDDGGAARASRHQFGDAADIVIDNNRDGRMDDLNRDGRLDLQDTEVILRAVERVEQRFPELVGGLGLYHAIGASGPFAHIDVRGSRARWSNRGARRTRAPRRAWSAEEAGAAQKVIGGCSASGEMAVLCVRKR